MQSYVRPKMAKGPMVLTSTEERVTLWKLRDTKLYVVGINSVKP